MTVLELKEQLDALPDDTVVKVRHELDKCEHYAESVEYDEENHTLWICETC